jgi:hypothetical protein
MKSTQSTLISFSFLISKAPMTLFAKNEGTKIPNGYKGKRKAKAMNFIWDVDSDDDINDSDNESSQSQELNFALMDVQIIITSKNITDLITI